MTGDRDTLHLFLQHHSQYASGESSKETGGGLLQGIPRALVNLLRALQHLYDEEAEAEYSDDELTTVTRAKLIEDTS